VDAASSPSCPPSPPRTVQPIIRSRFSTLPQFPQVASPVVGIERNYLNVAYSQFYYPASTNLGDSGGSTPRTREGQIDVTAALYTAAGGALLPIEEGGIRVPPSLAVADSHMDIIPLASVSGLPNRTAIMTSAYQDYIDVIVSEALHGAASVTVRTPLDLQILIADPNDGSRSYYADSMCKARAMVAKMPGFFYSSYRQVARLGAVLMSMDHYYALLTEAWTYVNISQLPASPPKQTLLIRTAAGSSQDARDDLVNGLRPFFTSSRITAIDTQFLIDTTNRTVELMTVFFTVVGVIAMVMCFFILWLSFSANVHENAWEFGVLRAIGLNNTAVVMVYVYEALALVLASVLMGTTIGLLIAVSLTLQFNLFTELPFKIDFPHLLFWVMLTMATTVAVVGSWLPAHGFMKKSISNVLRRQ
jgi:hypothetical protein